MNIEDAPIGTASEDVVGAITRKYAEVSAMFAAGRSGDEILQVLNWPDGIVTLPMPPYLFRGTAELLPTAREFATSMGRNVTFELQGAVLGAGDLAAATVLVTSHHDDRAADANYVLYVWQRRGEEWKVIREAVVVVAGE
ncbi:hypothetical protein [Sphingopyxis sp.]|jgi:hypothetical protein|uniref:hypothetical protein n=1 Tax=Sphingopyxis sp. TaxID=1908224 RepID=UPI002DF46E28|nr:hypothetical protein [Sphingopyxis sp.]